MSEFFGYEDMDPDEQEQRYRQEEMDRQQVIAECMRAEGFEYTVFVYEQSFSFESPYQDMTRREFVEKYGFGISTMFEDGFDPPEMSPDDAGDQPERRVREQPLRSGAGGLLRGALRAAAGGAADGGDRGHGR